MSITFDHGSVSLHIEEDGVPDGPPILFLHGITQSRDTWGWIVPSFAGTHRVLRLDHRGHGKSGRTPGAYDFEQWVGDAIAVCEQVVGQPAILVGHSLGGGTAAGVAQQRPDLVSGVVLEDAPLFEAGGNLEGNALGDGFAMMRTSVPELQASGIDAATLSGILAGSPAFGAETTFGELLHDDAVAAMASGLLELDASVLDRVIEGTSITVFDPNSPLPVPGIVLAADPAQPTAVTQPLDLERLARHSPLIDCRTVAGASHLIHDEKAHRGAVLQAVRDIVALVG